ncbi:MAG TPA: CRISPR-associated endonuclease Cas1 [Candidatus Syntrophosphaera thermopropionivorans]|jgi:CRISPR-associated protein Cas1|nr:CRISPR-associated endonuclease Cas1 [Candidatus Syntrophosphaera thermopropionivorans]HRC99849.1 CRISPR-associated endonuclease Cas1 [Candidatus Syntrophosphaera thermopropionivorans]
MSVVYVADQGASICKRGDRLYVFKGPNLLRWFHSKDIIQLIIVGNVTLTTPVLTYLLKYKIDTVFLSYYGKYKGRLIGEFGKNVQLRIAQFQFLNSLQNRENLAALYIQGKLNNMQTHLMRRLKRKKDKLISTAILQNQAILDKIENSSPNLDTLRGYEGIASKNYFSAFPALIFNPQFTFNGRNRRPPKDEVNALLSLGYTFLMNQVMGATYICGLDPYYGALHNLAYGRQSLALDLMEEFRPLVDNLVINLINRHEIRPEHFVYNQIPDDETDEEDLDESTKMLPVSMQQEGMKILITAFARMVNSRFNLEKPPGSWTLKDIFLLQARKLATHCEGKEFYTPFHWR